MLERFPYVKAAVMKPWYTYFITMMKVSPVQTIGMLFALIVAGSVGYAFFAYHRNDASKDHSEQDSSVITVTSNEQSSHHWRKMIWLGIFALWPLCFLLGLTLLGCLGSGYQTRFLLPALPGSAILTAHFLYALFLDESVEKEWKILGGCVLSIAFVVQAMLVLYYGIMYAPFYADVEVYWFDIMQTILSSPYHSASSRESVKDIQLFMKHFGFPFQ
jgi:hypothetical protein